jgi:hypothetical protein
MIDQSIVSVIKQHVLNDPEVTSLIDRMGGDGKLAEQFLRRVPLGTCGGNDFQPFEEVSAHPKIRRLQIRCTKVLERRLYALRALLRAGKLTVLGTSPHASARSMLDPEFWNQSHTFIDLTSGDVFYRTDDGSKLVLILRQPALERTSVSSVIPKAVIPVTTTKTLRKHDPTAAAGSQCQKWLAGEMEASPDHKPKSKAAHLEEALQRWGQKLSKEAFYRAWAQAMAETGANWGKSGRPPKSKG